MLALVFDNELELKEVPDPRPGPGEALVRVELAGICNTDLEILKGYMGFTGIFGHEFVGRVEESGRPDLVGKRVVGEINVGCGKCRWCRAGMERHCPNRTTLGIAGRNGSFAHYLVLPEKNLLEVPDSVSDEKAVFVEPLAAALEIRDQVNIPPAASLCVIGDGKLGLLTVMSLLPVSPDISVIGHHPERSKLIGGQVEWIEESASGRRFDLVVETSGSPSGLKTALAITRPRGTLVLKSTYAGTVEADLSGLVIDEISLVGSRCGRFRPALKLLEKGLLDPRPLIARRYDLRDYRKAFTAAKGNLKILLDIP